MGISYEEVKKTARLARLYLDDREMKSMEDKLNSILEYINKLDELDTEAVETMHHALTMRNVLREDRQVTFNDTESIIRQAPEHEDGYFKVKKIIE